MCLTTWPLPNNYRSYGSDYSKLAVSSQTAIMFYMLPTDKNNLRRRLLAAAQRDYSQSAGLLALDRLRTVLEKDAVGMKKILLYRANRQWREVDLSTLPASLPGLEFTFLSDNKSTKFPVEQYDAVVVPLLGFTDSGFRLGHGGGWYDKFLATQPKALKIGVGFQSSLVDFQPERHDIAMDVIVTDKSTCYY